MNEKEQKTVGWRARLKEFIGAIKNVPWAFSLLWEADARSAVAQGALTLIGAAVPISQAWITKLLIDGVLDSVRRNVPPQEGIKLILPLVFAELGLLFMNTVLGKLRSYYSTLVRYRLGHLINLRIIRKSLALEPRFFEDPVFYDKLETTRRESDFRTKGIISSIFSLVQNLLTLMSFLVLLFAFSPWITLFMMAAAIPIFMLECRYSQWNFLMQTGRATNYRSMRYLEQLLTLDSTVKEVRLFGLGEPLLQRYIAIFQKHFKDDMDILRRHSREELGWGLFGTLTHYGTYVWVIFLTLAGRTTLGGMNMYMTLFRQSRGAFEAILGNITELYANGLFMDNLVQFLSLKSEVLVLDQAHRPAEDPSQGIEFRGVWFQYPGREAWTIQDFSLKIKAGEKLALVGDNGAGKTTLIKLLTRLYEPTRGTILFRGVDLRYYSPDEIHRRLSAIFQDFVRYQVSLAENVGFGAVEHLEDRARIETAAHKSGAEEVAHTLPQRYDSMLGKWFKGGQELSGGQWQKIALGRAFMSEGEVLILDEPTAALDAESEYAVFQRFRELANGKLAILVSHRFSTVRMADRIAVLKGGRIAELGTHAELLAQAGGYSKLFELQAQGYR